MGHLHFWAFPIHTGPTLPLTPQIMLDACIQNFFWVSTLYRVGGRRTARKINFRKDALFYEGTQNDEKRNIALLSQGLFYMLVDNNYNRQCQYGLVISLSVAYVGHSSWRQLIKDTALNILSALLVKEHHHSFLWPWFQNKIWNQ